LGTWADDDHLLASLRDALREAAAVPPEFLEAGKAAFARFQNGGPETDEPLPRWPADQTGD
jgi:hypothetical protein